MRKQIFVRSLGLVFFFFFKLNMNKFRVNFSIEIYFRLSFHFDTCQIDSDFRFCFCNY